MTNNWHLEIQTGLELHREQHKLSWKEQADSFCNLPLYEQKQYCKECWRIGNEVAKQQELADQASQSKSVSEKVIEWHQKQLLQNQ